MSAIPEFDLINSPLDGSNLIEAGAGAGKTYTIAGLFIRLILEKRLPVDGILVVTFTNAATKELGDRIRKKLTEAISAFEHGASEDALLNSLAQNSPDRAAGLRCLREALINFDDAAIFTIHSFCGRILHDNAFESGNLFDSELIQNQDDIVEEIAEDFFRMNFYIAPVALVAAANASKISPDSFVQLMRGNCSSPDAVIIPDGAPQNLNEIDSLSSELQQIIKTISKFWESERDSIVRLLNTDSLKGTTYGAFKAAKKDTPSSREMKLDQFSRSMDDFVSGWFLGKALTKVVEYFSSEKIASQTKDGFAPPHHELFDLCASALSMEKELDELIQKHILYLKRKFIDFAREELPARKSRRNVQFFDDILNNLRAALKREGSQALADAVREKYKAALIDEFQDTDPVQYAIFDSLFGGGEGNKDNDGEGGGSLFLIGDPKQAIYSFRGADLFTYIEAAEKVARKYTLKTNWRSQPDLIEATNTIFSLSANPFVNSGISFHTALPAPVAGRPLLLVEGKSEAPFQLWYMDNHDDATKLIAKEKVLRRIASAVAAEISRLLFGGAKGGITIGEKPLVPGDVSVLVRSHREARLIRAALSTFKIPCVLSSAESVFKTKEAAAVSRIVSAIIEPGKESLIKAALSTDVFGLSGEELFALSTDETAWEKILIKFKDYKALWEKHGFMRMFRKLMVRERAGKRLLSLDDGERRMTNIFHIAELMNKAADERKFGMAGLAAWLDERINETATDADEHQLRLESDENAVRIVTIHKSKGLEYPVVFCPFVWGKSDRKKAKEPLFFHDENNNFRQTVDLGSDDYDDNYTLAAKEELAENVRLLYVALTRAKHRCYLVCGRINTSEASASSYLFHYKGDASTQDTASETAKYFKSINSAEWIDELKTIETKSAGSIELRALPEDAGIEYIPEKEITEGLAPRQFTKPIDSSWRVTSFSSLVSGRAKEAETPDRDPQQTGAVPAGADSTATTVTEAYQQKAAPQRIAAGAGFDSIFDFPRGSLPGSMLHEVFERLDFSKFDSDSDAIVSETLRKYGFDPRWKAAVKAMVEKVLSAPIGSPDDSFTLSQITNEHKISELEFYFPLKKVAPTDFSSALSGLYETPALKEAGLKSFGLNLDKLVFSPVMGFMKGFMDLVFEFEEQYFLIDWKSNHLGYSYENYSAPALKEKMAEELYVLQYLIYTVALDRYFKIRVAGYDYSTRFGGAYYMFLRGIDPANSNGSGIFFDKPDADLIEKLSRMLLDV